MRTWTLFILAFTNPLPVWLVHGMTGSIDQVRTHSCWGLFNELYLLFALVTLLDSWHCQSGSLKNMASRSFSKFRARWPFSPHIVFPGARSGRKYPTDDTSYLKFDSFQLSVYRNSWQADDCHMISVSSLLRWYSRLEFEIASQINSLCPSSS